MVFNPYLSYLLLTGSSQTYFQILKKVADNNRSSHASILSQLENTISRLEERIGKIEECPSILAFDGSTYENKALQFEIKVFMKHIAHLCMLSKSAFSMRYNNMTYKREEVYNFIVPKLSALRTLFLRSVAGV